MVVNVDVTEFGLQECHIGINQPDGLHGIALNGDPGVVESHTELLDLRKDLPASVDA